MAITGNLIIPVYDPQGTGIVAADPCLLVLWEKQTDKLIVYHLVLVLIRMEPLIQIKKTRAGFKQKLVVTVQLSL